MGTRNPIGGPFKRRVRRPFGKSSIRRPVRWIEGNSSHAGEPLPTVTSFTLSPTIDTSGWPAIGGTELIFGDDDLDWMDANEATLERLVGDVTVTSSQLNASSTDYIATSYYRLGLLAVQEVEDISTWVPPSLWDRESIEEYEWMWLYQGALQYYPNPVDGVQSYARETVHIDSHIRRKVGKKDHIVLLGQWGLGGPLTTDVVFSAVHLIRCLFKTK